VDTLAAAASRLDLDTFSEGIDNAGINFGTDFGLKASTQFNFGAVIWLKINSSNRFGVGVAHGLFGTTYAGTYGDRGASLQIHASYKNLLTGVTSASNVFTKNAHGLVNDQRVAVFGQTTASFVINATTNTFQLSASSGGASITIADGSNTIYDASKIWLRGLTRVGLLGDADNAFSVNFDTVIQLAIGWRLSGGIATHDYIRDGGVAALTGTGSDATAIALPAAPGNLLLGAGNVGPGTNATYRLKASVYRVLLENFTISGRTLAQMAAADYTANTGRFA
jgi:hypothetical protein